jgi:hypothetical protein
MRAGHRIIGRRLAGRRHYHPEEPGMMAIAMKILSSTAGLTRWMFFIARPVEQFVEGLRAPWGRSRVLRARRRNSTALLPHYHYCKLINLLPERLRSSLMSARARNLDNLKRIVESH